MKASTRRWLRIAGLAAITGSRTTLGPALAAHRFSRSRRARAVAYALAALELIGDKLPWTPNRTAPLGLGLRMASGAGLALALRRGRGRGVTFRALALGIAGALAGAFWGLGFRRALTRRLGGGRLASALAGGMEDAGLIAVGTRLARA